MVRFENAAAPSQARRASLGVALLLAVGAAGCARAAPPAVVIPAGVVHARLGGGQFSASLGRLRCSGPYNMLETNLSLPVAVRCNTGASGVAIVSRKYDDITGSLRLFEADGSETDYLFGHSPAWR